jgi:hypothetical protein
MDGFVFCFLGFFFCDLFHYYCCCFHKAEEMLPVTNKVDWAIVYIKPHLMREAGLVLYVLNTAYVKSE